MHTGVRNVSVRVTATLPVRDVDFLEMYQRRRGARSRSAALHDAVRALRDLELQSDYAQAYDEWVASGDAAAWDSVAGDGIA